MARISELRESKSDFSPLYRLLISYGSFLSRPLPRNSLHLLSPSSSTLSRPKKEGTATGVDIVCTHRPDPVVPGLDRERLYWELSLLTGGFTYLGPYTLDQDSFYINGEGGPSFLHLSLF